MFELRDIIPGSRPRDGRSAEGLSPGAAQARIEAAFRPKVSALAALLSIGLIWSSAGAYYALTPSRYVSKWSMILPTTSSGASVVLDTIGQSSTVPGQPFGNLSISPKVIYREIAASNQVRQAAADKLGLTLQALGKPRVKLIDETSLLLFEISGRTPEEAQAKANALTSAFDARLDALRRDEFERRATIVRDNLKLYQASLDAARAKILRFQRATGLLSPKQFDEAVSSAELVRRKLVVRRAELGQAEREQNALIDRVGVTPAVATVGLRLAAEPMFVKLSAAYVDAHAKYRSSDLRLGPNHPARVSAAAKREAALAEFERLSRRLNIDQSIDARQLELILNSSHQADIMHRIVAGEAKIEGHRKEVTSLEQELVRVEKAALRLGADAAQLEHLSKDHLVAQAVYTTAVARLDTNRSDIYSSYPMVQVLAAPELPVDRKQPRLVYAIAAGVAGSLLVLLAWGLAWVRSRFSRSRLRNASSTGP